jgi:hypothetical protein
VVAGGTTNYAANDLNQYNYVGSVYYDYDLNGNTTPFGQENGENEESHLQGHILIY